MKKLGLMIAATVVVVFALVMVGGEASSKMDQSPVDISALLTGFEQAPVPLSECAKIECGVCPGPNCLIDGICCYTNEPAKPGMASCGCTAEGKPSCKCDVGAPR